METRVERCDRNRVGEEEASWRDGMERLKEEGEGRLKPGKVGKRESPFHEEGR